jgi:hypothetical protein
VLIRLWETDLWYSFRGPGNYTSRGCLTLESLFIKGQAFCSNTEIAIIHYECILLHIPAFLYNIADIKLFFLRCQCIVMLGAALDCPQSGGEQVQEADRLGDISLATELLCKLRWLLPVPLLQSVTDNSTCLGFL